MKNYILLLISLFAIIGCDEVKTKPDNSAEQNKSKVTVSEVRYVQDGGTISITLLHKGKKYQCCIDRRMGPNKTKDKLFIGGYPEYKTSRLAKKSDKIVKLIYDIDIYDPKSVNKRDLNAVIDFKICALKLMHKSY